MRLPSPDLTPKELDAWLADGGLAADAPERERLRRVLGTMRERLRVSTARQRTAEISAYLTQWRAHPARPAGPRLPQWGRVPRFAFAEGGAEGGLARTLADALPWGRIAKALLVLAVCTALFARGESDANRAAAGMLLMATMVAGVPLPGLGVLLGSAVAGVWCHDTRLRTRRAWAVVASLIVLVTAFAWYWAMLKGIRCAAPGGVAFVPSVAVWTGALVGIAAAERGGGPRRSVVFVAMVSAIPWGYLSMPIVMFGCSRS